MTDDTLGIFDQDLRRSLRERVEAIDGVETAFVAGSLVEGIGNHTSDIDLIIVTGASFRSSSVSVADEENFFSINEHQFLVSEVRSRRLDVEFKALGAVEALIDRIRQPRTRTSAFAGAVEQSSLEFLHDLRIGLPVIAPDKHHDLVESVDWLALRNLLVDRFEYICNGHMEDAAGAIEAHDPGLALLTSRAALQASVDAYLASKGETNPKPKWRFRKIEARQFDALLARYLELELDLSVAPDSLLAQARERVLFAQDLLLDARSG